MRLNSILLLGCLLLPSFTISLEAWQRSFGSVRNEVALGIAPAPDGGAVLAGFTQSAASGKRDVWVIRVNPNSSILWQKSYGTSSDEVATSIARIPLGGFIVAGYTRPSENSSEVKPLLFRIDDLGHIVWQKSFDKKEALHFNSVLVTSSGEIIVAGEHENPNSGVWISKFNLNGEILWQEKIGGNEQAVTAPVSIKQTTDGGVIVIGQKLARSTENVVRFSEIWIAKLATSGDVQWQKRYGLPQRGEYGDAITPIAAGGYLVAATQSNDSEDILILRLNSSGAIQWQKKLAAIGNESIRSIVETGNGNFLLGGVSNLFVDRALLLTVNPSGNLLRRRILSNASSISAGLLLRADGGFTAAGHTRWFEPKLADFWVMTPSSISAPACSSLIRLISTTTNLIANQTSFAVRKTNLKRVAGGLIEQSTFLTSRQMCSR